MYQSLHDPPLGGQGLPCLPYTTYQPLPYPATTSSDTTISSSDIDRLPPKRVRRRLHWPNGHKAKRGRPTRNPCWTYFHRIDNRQVQCHSCGKVVRSACATNMTKHLERHHAKLMLVSHELQNTEETISPIHSSTPPSIDIDIKSDVDNDINVYLHEEIPIVKPLESMIIDYTPADPINILPQSTEINHEHDWTYGLYESMDSSSPLKSTPPDDSSISSLSWTASSRMSGGEQSSSVSSSWDNGRPPAKRNRRTKHPVWELFRRTNSGQAQCQLCNAFVRSPCSSNFMGHLNRHHGDHYQDVYNRWLNGRRSSTASSDVQSSAPPPTDFSPPQNVRLNQPTIDNGTGLLIPSQPFPDFPLDYFHHYGTVPVSRQFDLPHATCMDNQVPPSSSITSLPIHLYDPSQSTVSSSLDTFQYVPPPPHLLNSDGSAISLDTPVGVALAQSYTVFNMNGEDRLQYPHHHSLHQQDHNLLGESSSNNIAHHSHHGPL